MGADGAEPPISRSPFKIEREAFETLFRLHAQQPWLTHRQEALFDLFEICKTLDEQELVWNLLYRFTYLSREKFREQINVLKHHIISEWQLKPDDTIIVSARRSRFMDSSDAAGYLLKSAFGTADDWGTTNFVAGLGAAAELAVDGSNIVLVDEFIGSGDTVKKAAGWIRDKLAERGMSASIYICAVTAMERAKSNLDLTGAIYFAANWLKRGISDHFTGNELTEAIGLMNRLESELCDKHRNGTIKKYYFGYKRSEALYHWQDGNTPNNVFPIFWWECLKTLRRRRTILARIGT